MIKLNENVPQQMKVSPQIPPMFKCLLSAVGQSYELNEKMKVFFVKLRNSCSRVF